MAKAVFEQFRDRFISPKVKSVGSETDADLVRFAQQRTADINDMKVFVGTLSYTRFRKRLEHALSKNKPLPEHGTDVAACFTFKQEGLREALDILDNMVRLVEEQNSHG